MLENGSSLSIKNSLSALKTDSVRGWAKNRIIGDGVSIYKW
jgi:hypothetical protein